MSGNKTGPRACIDVGALLPEVSEVDDEMRAQLSELLELSSALRTVVEEANGLIREFESRDRLENFEVQDLMSRYTEAQNLMSQVACKKDDLCAGQIQKIG